MIISTFLLFETKAIIQAAEAQYEKPVLVITPDIEVGPGTRLHVLVLDEDLDRDPNVVEKYEADQATPNLVVVQTSRPEIGASTPDLTESSESGSFGFTLQLVPCVGDDVRSAVGGSSPEIGVCPGDSLWITYNDDKNEYGVSSSARFSLDIMAWDPEYYSDKVRYSINDSATIRIRDQDANIDPREIDHLVNIRVSSDADRIGQKFTVFETGENTGVFTFSFSLSSEAKPGAIVVSHNDCVLVEYVDRFPSYYNTEESFHGEYCVAVGGAKIGTFYLTEKEYPVAIFSTYYQFRDISAHQYGIQVQMDTLSSHDDHIDLSLPYELVEYIWPEVRFSDANLEGLEVFVDGESVPRDVVRLGSRVTLSFDIPAGSETLDIAGGMIAAALPLITLDIDNPTGVVNPGDTISVQGRIDEIGKISNELISVQVKDPFSNVISSQNVTTDKDGRYSSSVSIPLSAVGGSYEISTRVPERALSLQALEFFHVSGDGYYYGVEYKGIKEVIFISTNSTLNDVFLMKNAKTLGLAVSGEYRTSGHTTVVLPHSVLGGSLEPFAYPEVQNVAIARNSTHTIIDLDYQHETSIVEISGTTVIPEFGASVALIASAVAITTTMLLRRTRLS